MVTSRWIRRQDRLSELRADKKIEQIASETVNDKLIKLASQFAEMALGKKQTPVLDFVEIEPQEAIEEGELIPNPTPGL